MSDDPRRQEAEARLAQAREEVLRGKQRQVADIRGAEAELEGAGMRKGVCMA